MPVDNTRNNLIIVGSGIAGLMTAYHAASSGFEVCLLSQSPDPRSGLREEQLSSTFDGLDSRYVTLTEGHPYLGIAEYADAVYPDMQGAFTKPISDGGWLGKPQAAFRPLARAWLAERYEANKDRGAIRELFDQYIRENRASMRYWYEFLRDSPDLHTPISLNSKGILRVYDQQRLFEVAADFHRTENVLKEVLSPSDLEQRFPAYKDGVRGGFVQGGAIVMYGLTFRVQALCVALIEELEALGARLLFRQKVVQLDRNREDVIRGLRTSAGTCFRADNYVLHLGAYCAQDLLRETPAHGKLAGVQGFWVRWRGLSSRDLEELGGLPVKIHGGITVLGTKKRPVVDLNVNIVSNCDGSTELLVGGGYNFVGFSGFETSADAEEIAKSEIHRVLAEVYGDFFGKFSNGEVETVARSCVRSWVPDDRELDINLPTEKGGLAMIHGGGNTGTTAKAAFIARSVVAKLRAVRRGESLEPIELLRKRASLSASRIDVQVQDWQDLEDGLTA